MIANEVPESPPTPWLTIPEAAARAQLGTRTIVLAHRAGKLKVSGGGHGKDIRIHVDDLDEWLRYRR